MGHKRQQDLRNNEEEEGQIKKSRYETSFWEYWKEKQRVKIKIYPIHLCAGAGIPELAVEKAVEILNEHEYQIELLQGERYETNEEANRMARALGTKAQEIGDISKWPERAKQLRAKEGTLFLVTGGTPCTKLTGLVRKWDSRARIGPHMTPSNLLFAAHEGIQVLQQNNRGKMICLTEQVVPAFEHWEREIESMFGHKRTRNWGHLQMAGEGKATES